MWEIGPIFRALMRNKVGAALIALQIAVTMAIIVNGISIISERQKAMARPSGVDEHNSFYISSTGFATDFNTKVTVDEDLAMIRRLPGVVDATEINAIPLSGGGWSMGLKTDPKSDTSVSVAVYMVDDHGVNALDVKVIAGQNFQATDIRWRGGAQSNWPAKVMITKAMAKSLYPDKPWQSAVGKTVYIDGEQAMIITGIIDQLQAPWNGWDHVENVMLSPEKTLFDSNRYFIRTKPGQRDRIMSKVEQMLAESNKGRIIRNMRSMDETRERSYRKDSAMINILTTVMVTLTIVTALGIVGLASFNVNRRKKQIGTRRALGATKLAVMRYFMLENFLISTVGVFFGAILTVGLNIWLVHGFSLQHIAWYLIPTGMITLWIVGQIAVWGPARRAANIPPALATRTV